MSKKVYLIISALVLILAITLFFVYQIANNKPLFMGPKTPPKELVTVTDKHRLGLYHGANFEVVSRDQNGEITEYRMVGLIEPKEIPLDLMKEEEKKDIGLSSEQKIQVLERSPGGSILVYRLINSDEDIVKEY